VKTVHKLFPKQFIEKVLKDAPGGTSLKLLTTYKGVHLIAVGYKYNKKCVLHFIMTENAGSTGPGNPYEMKFADEHRNVCIHKVSRPEVISEFFMIAIVWMCTINCDSMQFNWRRNGSQPIHSSVYTQQW
jgi:hypothetical protein